jgi:hypothetical protein
MDFVPLTVEYNEKYYAAGKIPGGFIKRETRPKDQGNPRVAPDRQADEALFDRSSAVRSK